MLALVTIGAFAAAIGMTGKDTRSRLTNIMGNNPYNTQALFSAPPRAMRSKYDPNERGYPFPKLPINIQRDSQPIAEIARLNGGPRELLKRIKAQHHIILTDKFVHEEHPILQQHFMISANPAPGTQSYNISPDRLHKATKPFIV